MENEMIAWKISKISIYVRMTTLSHQETFNLIFELISFWNVILRILHFFTNSLTKLKLTTICLIFEWNNRLCAKYLAPRLSIQIVDVVEVCHLIPLKRFCIQIIHCCINKRTKFYHY